MLIEELKKALADYKDSLQFMELDNKIRVEITKKIPREQFLALNHESLSEYHQRRITHSLIARSDFQIEFLR